MVGDVSEDHRWGEDEEVEGQSSVTAPIALHGQRPVPRVCGGGEEEAGERRVAGQLPE
jgi:hypothetical protein